MHAPAGYRILSEIGRGGMGVVYRALQVDLKREVALKCLLPEIAHDPAVLTRLRREAAAMSRVAHPGLVKLLDVGEDGGQPYLCMEIVPGASLADQLRARPKQIAARADTLLEGILEALAALHAAGLTHRDLKPSNVMVTPDGQPVLMDLGLVKDVSRDGTLLTAQGQMIGTPAYLAPELLGGVAANPRSDMWALGCVYYELVTGRRVFRADSLVVMCALILEGTLPDLAAECAALSPARLAFLERLLAKDPAARPADARQALALHRAAGRAPADSTPTPLRQALPARGARTPGLTAAAAAGLVALAVLAARPRDPGPRDVPPSPSAPAVASASPSPRAEQSPAPGPGKRRLSKGWDDQYDYYAKLLALGGKPAERALRDIVQRAGVPLAAVSPEVGLRWLDLGRWLAHGAALDLLPASLREGSTTRLTQQVLWSTGGLFTPEQLAVILLTQEPGEARGWLALGYSLGTEGEHAMAQRAYALAMERPLGEVSETEWPRYLEIALVHAAMRTPGLLERKWPEWVTRSDIERTGWEALVDALAFHAVERLDALLEAGERARPEDSLYIAWSRHQQHAGPRGGAQAVLLRGLKKLPRSQAIDNALLEEAGNRGMAEEVQPYVTALNWKVRVEVLRPFMNEGGPRRGEVTIGNAVAFALRPALEQLIAERGVDALPEIERRLAAGDWEDRTGLWALDSLALGFEHPTLTAYAEKQLRRGLPGYLLYELEGMLATPAGAPWFERILADPGPLANLPVDSRRAVWLARRARYAEALDVFDRQDTAALGAWPVESMIEVMTRPLWTALLGERVEPALLDRARATIPRLLTGDVAPRVTGRPGQACASQAAYLRALLAGRFADAALAADDLAARAPMFPLWTEVVAWQHWLAGERAAFAHEVWRAQRACAFTSTAPWYVRRLKALKK